MNNFINDLQRTIETINVFPRPNSNEIIDKLVALMKQNNLIKIEPYQFSTKSEILKYIPSEYCTNNDYCYFKNIPNSVYFPNVTIEILLENLIDIIESEENFFADTEELKMFIKKMIELINVVIPRGIKNNLVAYANQEFDYNINVNKLNNKEIKLIKCFEIRRTLFHKLINFSVSNHCLGIGLSLYNKYSSKYNIRPISFFSSININDIQSLSYNELQLLKNILFAYKHNAILYSNKNDNLEECRFNDYKDLLMKVKNILSINQVEFKNLFDKIEKMSFSNIDYNLLSKGRREINKYIPPEMAMISNPDLRYYLSILDYEYNEFKNVENKDYDTNIKKLIKNYMKEINEQIKVKYNDLIEKEIEKAKQEMFKVPENEIKKYVLSFFENAKKCASFNYTVSFIEPENLYNKIKANREVTSVIAYSQKRFENRYSFDQEQEDYTFIVVTPIKLIERYLKLIILQCCQGETIYQKYNFKTGRESSDFKITIDPNHTIHSLSHKGSDNVPLELATLGFLVIKFFEKCFDISTCQNASSSFFNLDNSENPTFDSWRENVRNGYLHSDDIDTINDVEVIFFKTAFCMSKIVYELKALR